MVIEKYSGRWIAVIADRGITGSGMSPKFIRLIIGRYGTNVKTNA